MGGRVVRVANKNRRRASLVRYGLNFRGHGTIYFTGSVGQPVNVRRRRSPNEKPRRDRQNLV